MLEASSARASLEAAAAASAVIGGSAAESKGNCDADAITRRESQATVGGGPLVGWTTASGGPDNLEAVVPAQVNSDALEQTDAAAVLGSGSGVAAATAEEATGKMTEPLGTGVISQKEQTMRGRDFSRKRTFAAEAGTEATPAPTLAIDETEGARVLDRGVLKANVAGAALSYTRACSVGRESRGEGSKPEPPPAAATSVTSGRGSDVRVAPVLSLSGHLIGPEAMRGDGDGDSGAKNGYIEGWARDTFMREAVTWDDFARYPQV